MYIKYYEDVSLSSSFRSSDSFFSLSMCACAELKHVADTSESWVPMHNQRSSCDTASTPANLEDESMISTRGYRCVVLEAGYIARKNKNLNLRIFFFFRFFLILLVTSAAHEGQNQLRPKSILSQQVEGIPSEVKSESELWKREAKIVPFAQFFSSFYLAAMAQYDLTSVIAPYLDRHLVLPLLEHLQKTKVGSAVIQFSTFSLA